MSDHESSPDMQESVLAELTWTSAGGQSKRSETGRDNATPSAYFFITDRLFWTFYK